MACLRNERIGICRKYHNAGAKSMDALQLAWKKTTTVVCVYTKQHAVSYGLREISKRLWLTDKVIWVTNNKNSHFLYLLHERLPIDTLPVLHQRLLTHLNNHYPCHKPAILSSTLTLLTFTTTHTDKLSDLMGVTWQTLSRTAGHIPIHHGRGFVQSAKGQMLYFKMLSARLNSGSTNNYYRGQQAPCWVTLVRLAIQESNYCKPTLRTSASPHFLTLPDVLIKKWKAESCTT